MITKHKIALNYAALLSQETSKFLKSLVLFNKKHLEKTLGGQYALFSLGTIEKDAGAQKENTL